MVRTTSVTGRRELHFTSLDEVLEDARAVCRGNPTALGNWSPGQILMHLARSIDASIDGIPGRLSWPMRMLGKVLKKRLLTGRLRAGFKPPRQIARQLMPGETSTEAGLKALTEAIERLKQTSDRAPHIFLGELTADQWEQFHLRHAELHLSFLLPG